MAYEQRDNSGSLFKNDRKEKESHPDYKGTAMIDGKMYWLSAWLKTGNNGSKFFSFAFKPKDDQRAFDCEKRPPAAAMAGTDMDDDIPF